MAGYLGIEANDTKPYIFVSYNTEDQERICNIIQALQKHQINIWYDNGIQRISDEEWQEQIAVHIRHAEIVFFFISLGIFAKQNSFVRKEYDLASRHNKNVCVVLLDSIDVGIIPAKYDFWWDEIVHRQCIEAVGKTDQEIAEEMFSECHQMDAFNNEGKQQTYDEIYCYKNSGVLKNKLNIIDETQLNCEINNIIDPIAKHMIEKPIKGAFTYEYLKKIHKKLYGQIFDWAGHTRTVNISDSLEYCKCNYIIPQAEELFAELQKENYLREYDKAEIFKRFAYYLGELNAIHPFRYGNQVTQEVFITILAKKVGYSIDFNLADRNRLTNGYIQAYGQGYELLEQELLRIEVH